MSAWACSAIALGRGSSAGRCTCSAAGSLLGRRLPNGAAAAVSRGHVGRGGAQPLVSAGQFHRPGPGRGGRLVHHRSTAATRCSPATDFIEKCGDPVAVGYAGHLWPQPAARRCERSDRGSQRLEHRRQRRTIGGRTSIRCIFRIGRGSTSCGMTWDCSAAKGAAALAGREMNAHA